MRCRIVADGGLSQPILVDGDDQGRVYFADRTTKS